MDEPKKKPLFRRSLLDHLYVWVAIGVLLIVYFVAYMILITPTIPEGFGTKYYEPIYHAGGPLTEAVFAPAHAVDAYLVRPDFWLEPAIHVDPVPFDDFGEEWLQTDGWPDTDCSQIHRDGHSIGP